MSAEEVVAAFIKLIRGKPRRDHVTFDALDPIHQDPTNMTASRALDTTYQNTHRKPIFVVVALQFDVNDSTSALGAAGSIGKTSGTLYSQANISYDNGILDNGSSGDLVQTLFFMVPNQWYYEVGDWCFGTNQISSFQWWEYKI